MRYEHTYDRDEAPEYISDNCEDCRECGEEIDLDMDDYSDSADGLGYIHNECIPEPEPEDDEE